MSKRGNNIYHRADGRWEGRYYCKGTNKYKSVYGKTYTEAKSKLDKLRSEVFQPSKTCHYLFSDVMKMWLESRKSRIKESSYANYYMKLNKQILPYFGHMKYSQLDAQMLDSFTFDKLKQGFSEKYVADMVIMIKSAAKWAESVHHYANQTENAVIPKVKTKETAVFTLEEQKSLLYIIYNSVLDLTALGILIALFTGIRIGELCALQWSDVDFTNKILHIRKTIQRIPVYGQKSKTAVRVTSPKSATSVREIPLPDFLIEKLSQLKDRPENYILSGAEKPIEPRCFANHYKTLLKKADIPSKKFHALRHTFATNALQQNFDVKTLSEILGHANANVTMKAYVHSSMEQKTLCMNRLQSLL